MVWLERKENIKPLSLDPGGYRFESHGAVLAAAALLWFFAALFHLEIIFFGTKWIMLHFILHQSCAEEAEASASGAIS